MIRVTLHRGGIRVLGHASGAEIAVQCCAAVSALVSTLVDMTGRGTFQKGRVSWPWGPPMWKMLHAEFVVRGLRNIAASPKYGQYISISGCAPWEQPSKE